ncbi:MAG: sel1 repeat family protein, partial [Rhodospirillaceae bacterium]|nr:sel1 repeat family protein [Rhodospirillaceae bacterium]
DAQTNLGLMLHYGQGVERDVENAIRWYRVAAERGNSMAQLKLGLTYDDGDGVAKDQAEAAEWYLLAARQGDATAQRKLAYLYATGQGIEPDAAAAFDWYAEAAKQALSEVWAEIVDMKWFIAVIATIILVFWSIAADLMAFWTFSKARTSI